MATDNDNGNIPALTDDGKDPFEDGPYDLALINSDSLTLPGGEYYFTSVELHSSTTLNIAGPTVMYVTGTFAMTSSSIMNPSQKPEDLIIFVSSIEDVQFHSSTDFYGIIYAPDAHVVNNSSVDFYGGIMAQEVTLNSSGVVHYDESLDDMDLVNGVEFASGGTASSTLVQ